MSSKFENKKDENSQYSSNKEIVTSNPSADPATDSGINMYYSKSSGRSPSGDHKGKKQAYYRSHRGR